MKSPRHLNIKTTTLFTALLMISSISWSQKAENGHGEEEKHMHHRHLVSVFLGHSYIPEGIEENGRKSWLILASWGVDYNYRVSETWSLGVHSDWVVENYSVENLFDSNEPSLNRERPLALVAVSSFKLNEHLGWLVGAGGEFSKEENLFLIRAGMEYSVEFIESWELAISLQNDLKLEAYNSWFLGLGIGKAF